MSSCHSFSSYYACIYTICSFMPFTPLLPSHFPHPSLYPPFCVLCRSIYFKSVDLLCFHTVYAIIIVLYNILKSNTIGFFFHITRFILYFCVVYDLTILFNIFKTFLLLVEYIFSLLFCTIRPEF
jgi:hypothetical protein